MREQIGYFFNSGNNTGEFIERTCLLSSTYASLHGVHIPKENIRRSIALFNVRCLSKHTWVNDSGVCIGRKK